MMREDDEAGVEMSQVNRMNPFTLKDQYDDDFLDDDMESAQPNRDGNYSVVAGGSHPSPRRLSCRCILIFVALVTVVSYGYSIITTTEEIKEEHEDYDSFVDEKPNNDEFTHENHGGIIPPGMAPVPYDNPLNPKVIEPEGSGPAEDTAEGEYDDEEERYYSSKSEGEIGASEGEGEEEEGYYDEDSEGYYKEVEGDMGEDDKEVDDLKDAMPDTNITMAPVVVLDVLDPETSDKDIPVPQQNSDFEEWLSRPVTLQDGIQFEIIDGIAHDKDAFLEGLCYANGYLYESTGLQGKSDIRKIDPANGEIVEQVKMEKTLFGEGLTVVKDRLFQLSYKKKQGFIYDINKLQDPPETFDYNTGTGEGWGMTYDETKNELILNDGNDYLIFWDPETHTEKRKLKVVRQDGSPAMKMNELEFWRGRVLANVWYEDVILVINPETGECEKEYDFTSLAYNSKTYGAVLNGISVSDDPDVLFISGKLWDTIFKVKLL